MQTCSKCNSQSPDSAIFCATCSADLREFSNAAVALNRFRANPRIEVIRLVVDEDACPACQAAAGNYPKMDAPSLPIPGCSNGDGCRCFFEPLLTEIYP